MIKQITLDNWPELWAKLTERFPQKDLRSRALSMPKAKKVEDLTFPNQPNSKNGWQDIIKSKPDWKVEGVAQIAWYVDARAIRRRLNTMLLGLTTGTQTSTSKRMESNVHFKYQD